MLSKMNLHRYSGDVFDGHEHRLNSHPTGPTWSDPQQGPAIQYWQILLAANDAFGSTFELGQDVRRTERRNRWRRCRLVCQFHRGLVQEMIVRHAQELFCLIHFDTSTFQHIQDGSTTASIQSNLTHTPNIAKHPKETNKPCVVVFGERYYHHFGSSDSCRRTCSGCTRYSLHHNIDNNFVCRLFLRCYYHLLLTSS